MHRKGDQTITRVQQRYSIFRDSDVLVVLLTFLLHSTAFLANANPIQTPQNPPNTIDLATQNEGMGDVMTASTEEGEASGLLPGSERRWTSIRENDNYIVPYMISGRYAPNERQLIAKVMQAISSNTCIKFRETDGNDGYDFIDIQNSKGCFSGVGRIPGGGRNPVFLKSTRTEGTCMNNREITHELLHTLGLHHEHNRADRDRYINIIVDNVQQEYRNQFAKVNPIHTTAYGVPYDYRSIMHYKKDSAARASGLITIETKNKAFQNIIGTSTDASVGDYQKICAMYECTTCMGHPFDSTVMREFESPASESNIVVANPPLTVNFAPAISPTTKILPTTTRALPLLARTTTIATTTTTTTTAAPLVSTNSADLHPVCSEDGTCVQSSAQSSETCCEDCYSCTITHEDKRCCHCSFTNPDKVCPFKGWTAPGYNGPIVNVVPASQWSGIYANVHLACTKDGRCRQSNVVNKETCCDNCHSCTVTTDDGQRCCHCSFTNPYTVCPLGGWTAPSYSGGGPVRSNGVGTRKRF